jgi:hypothetical protein
MCPKLKNEKANGDDEIINEYIKSTYILSGVEYPWRKPDWFSLKTEKDSENSVNLSFSIAVKSLH